MYYPLRNPYGQQQSGSSCCCVTVLVGFLIAFTILGVHFAGNIGSTSLLAIDLISNPEVGAAFNEFIEKYGKSYGTEDEMLYRYRVFADNYRKINEFNADPEKTSTVEVNMFADLTDEEFQKTYLSRTIATGSKEENYIQSTTDLDKDWTNKTTPVKDQGMCGSCWTFSSISVFETLLAIKGEKAPISYSEQELVDCCRKETNTSYNRSNGCGGGEDEDALDYIINYGISKTRDYPYKATDNQCKTKSLDHTKGLIGQQAIKTSQEMEKAIQEQTISVGVAAGHFAFRFYKSGVVTKGCPGDIISHAVTAVGAGTENGIKYWNVRNSWGPNWGNKGHIKLMRVEEGCGVCGINCYSRIPIHDAPKS